MIDFLTSLELSVKTIVKLGMRIKRAELKYDSSMEREGKDVHWSEVSQDDSYECINNLCVPLCSSYRS